MNEMEATDMNEIKIPERFTVRRGEWVRGTAGCESQLLNRSGRRCCVGFLARECGLSDEEVLGAGYFSYHRIVSQHPEARDIEDRLQGVGVYPTNDDPKLTDPERESLLTAKFAALGIVVEFVD